MSISSADIQVIRQKMGPVSQETNFKELFNVYQQ